MDHRKQLWQIFLLAVVGIGGTAFGLGTQLCLAIDSGNGWWKVGTAVFAFLCLIFVLWTLLRQAFAGNTHA
jgi:uncharacterized membrane protein YqjE